MRQLKYIGVVFAALMLFTACEKEFDAIPEDFATVPEGSDELLKTLSKISIRKRACLQSIRSILPTISSLEVGLLPMTVRATYINISLYKVWTMTILV